ncbi:Tuberoinfundibular peptide of 39 residues [Vulpes lagopus]
MRLLLLLLLLLVPWGHRSASGVALPPAGVLSLRGPGRAWAGPATPLSRRSLALADDAAFRERARLLAALERRHWLNSYMHKLLVLDAR